MRGTDGQNKDMQWTKMSLHFYLLHPDWSGVDHVDPKGHKADGVFVDDKYLADRKNIDLLKDSYSVWSFSLLI